MEKGNKSEKASKALGPDFLVPWGNRKRIRCVRVKDPKASLKFSGGSGIRKKITSGFLFSSDKENSQIQSNRFTRNSEGATLRSLVNQSLAVNENRKSPSSEREDRCYTRRGSVGCVDENGKVSMDVNGNGVEDRGGFVWPKLYIALSSKEKEEDFLAMKGCKPPQRPKKRAKTIQRSLLLVSPGAWLTEMSQERYEVREKKSTKKRPRGLKAMGSIETESE